MQRADDPIRDLIICTVVFLATQASGRKPVFGSRWLRCLTPYWWNRPLDVGGEGNTAGPLSGAQPAVLPGGT